MDNLTSKYIDKIEGYWKDIIKCKYIRYYNNLISISHLSGIHLDFYHKPYIFMNKKYPEIIFKNAILKKIMKLNKLLYKEIYLPIESINIMIYQCNMIMKNKDYWARHGYNDFQIISINYTYLLFKKYLLEYLIYLANRKKTINTNIIGLDKSK